MPKPKLSIKKTNPNNNIKLPSVVRRALTGVAIGGYFGIFHRPVDRDRDFVYAIGVACVMSILITVIQNWNKPFDLARILNGFIKLIIVLSIFWVSMEYRQIFYDSTGKIGVVIFMTSIGTLLGLVYGMNESRKSKQKTDT
ncbi:MAG: hypothetical protein CL606_05790 [Anaerolineaceae bacterium]|nr:hypothetical protein [Anaerolineaceae bacterium]MBS60798.1 hypothetical protein [Anaerolineaceae bacterium]|tara:strand:+ start:36840 stop:37262 length:423 start_codon:yes stop_codon:yes gene_type:complete